jgi:hypothetical protein
MAQSLHPAAHHPLPAFITAPGETDVLMVVMALVLLLAVVAFGLVFLRLHTLPERMAHKSQKIQFEIVAVLGLIALFTHMHIFWIAGLLLALIELPDFGSSLGRIADSAETIAGMKPAGGAAAMRPGAIADDPANSEAAAAQREKQAAPREGSAAVRATAPDAPSKRKKELRHA